MIVNAIRTRQSACDAIGSERRIASMDCKVDALELTEDIRKSRRNGSCADQALKRFKDQHYVIQSIKDG